MALFAVAVVLPGAADAQLGTGGNTGTAGTITAADIFLSVQRQRGVNLIPRERDRFLNRANCQCQTPAYLRAAILPSAAVRVSGVNPAATVSMYIGNNCDNTNIIGCCLKVGSMPFSQFRLSGMYGDTRVDQLARLWASTPGNCGPAGVSTGTGGVSGGGSGGAGGDAGTGGTSGATPPGYVPCGNGTEFAQTVWLFIGTAGDGSLDIVRAPLGFSVDPQPPTPPTNISIKPAHEALIASWTPLSTAEASDILGYQVLCTRADRTQVFPEGTFKAGFDTCAENAAADWPESPPAKTAFVCSDLLSTSTTSTRLKILENGITYGVGVVAVDKKGNASVVDPTYQTPIATRDFYYDYRHGEPQGEAVGGYCSVSRAGTRGLTVGWLAGVGLVSLILVRRRRANARRGDRK